MSMVGAMPDLTTIRGRYEALGFPTPTFAHVPLIFNEQGKRLSKRTQSMGLDPLRNKEMRPEQVVGELAASCGLIENGKRVSAKELVCSTQENRLRS